MQQNSTKNKSMPVTTLTFIALFTVLITICSWLSIPITGIPITMQTFAIFLTIYLLGPKYSAFSIIVYLILGAIGLPVFAGFGSGIGYLLGPTGGYLLGFLGTALIYALFRKLFGKSYISQIVSSLLGLVTCYALGTAWFIHVYTQTSGSISIMATLSMTVFPFVIFDIAKIVIAILLDGRLKRFLPKF